MSKSRGVNKRKGSRCAHKMMSARAAKRRTLIHLYWMDKLARRAAARVTSKARNTERGVV